MRKYGSLFRILQYESGIIHAHDYQSGTLAFVLRVGAEGQFHGCGEVVRRGFLQQQVGHIPQALVIIRNGIGVKTHHTPVAGVICPFIIDVGVPLPLRRQGVAVELIAFLRSTYGVCLTYIGLAVGQYGFAASVPVFICSDYRPVVNPLHGLQMYYTSVGAYILKVHEPVFTGRRVHPATLMRPVDG